MRYPEDLDLAMSYGRKAMELMSEHRSPATPPNYEVWYNYVVGRNKTLVKILDEAKTEDGNLPLQAVEKIYDEHLSETRVVEQIEELGTQIGGEVSQVMDFVQAAIGQADQYGESLDSVTRQLGAESNDSDSLNLIVKSLIETTKQMRETNASLETRLQESSEQITQLNASLTAVQTESRTDQLTAIANRKQFDESIERFAAEARETGEEFCMIIGDVDHFKKFNDTHGHTTGDQVLRFVAHALKSNIKGRDLAARYGGEEFAILLPRTKLQSAVIVANQVRAAIQAKELVKKSTSENLGRITMSFGVARYRPGESMNDFINRADICLYQAKKAGRNLVRCETDPDVTLTPHVA